MNKSVKTAIANVCRVLPDSVYLRIRYYLTFHKPLNTHNPIT